MPGKRGNGRPKRFSEAIMFTVTPEQREMLVKRAWDQGMSISHLIRVLVERGIAAEKGPDNERH